MGPSFIQGSTKVVLLFFPSLPLAQFIFFSEKMDDE
jgi:hypothetical protein